MSVKIDGFKSRDGTLAYEPASVAARIMCATGEDESRVRAEGVRCAKYAGQIIFSALDKIGALREDFTEEEYLEALDEIERLTITTKGLGGQNGSCDQR